MSFYTHFPKVAGNQRGIALISALLLLLVVSLMAVAVSMDTSMDIRIAGYQRFSARSFGFADGGGLVATDMVEDNYDATGWDADSGDLDYPELSDRYDGTIIIKQGHGDFYMDQNLAGDPVIVMTGDIEAEIVVQKGEIDFSRGSGLQVASGYSGKGKSVSAGGANRYYNVTSTGTGSDKAGRDLAVNYRLLTQ